MTTHLPTRVYPRYHLAFPVTDLDAARMSDATSLVDGKQVPVRHFGGVADLATFDRLFAK